MGKVTNPPDSFREVIVNIARTIGLCVLVLGTAPARAEAQLIEFMEWLDKLSGPGPFQDRPVSIRLPFGCVTHETVLQGKERKGANDSIIEDLRNFQRGKFTKTPESAIRPDTTVESPVNASPGKPDPASAVATSLGELTQATRRRVIFRHAFDWFLSPSFYRECLGIVAMATPNKSTKSVWGSRNLTIGNERITEEILQRRNVVGFEFHYSRSKSLANDLEYPASVEEDDKRIGLDLVGVGARLLSEDAFVYSGWSLARFSAPLLISKPLRRHVWINEVGVKPLARSASPWLRPVTASVGVINWFEPFTAADFGARGPYRANDTTAFARIGYDLWWHGCFKVEGRCP